MPCALRESTRSSHGLTSLSIASSSLFTTPLSPSLVGLRDTCFGDICNSGEMNALWCVHHALCATVPGILLQQLNREQLHDEDSACSSLWVRHSPTQVLLLLARLHLVCSNPRARHGKKEQHPSFRKTWAFQAPLPIRTHLSAFAKAIHLGSLTSLAERA